MPDHFSLLRSSRGSAFSRFRLAWGVLLMPLALTAQTLPEGVTERPLAITGGPVQLPGTLTIPAGKGPFPALIIIHGSGPGDRDLTVGPNAPYRDIAWGLAQRGVAVFRFDKRSKVDPNWFANKAFTVKDEVLDDAELGLRLLRNQPEVDSTRVLVLGHSLGGVLAPRIAAQDPRVAGLILLAGATRAALPDQVDRQIAYLESLGGATGDGARAQQAAVSALTKAIRELTPADSASTSLLIGAPPAYYLDLRRYDPATTAAALPIPILILQGERDYQVTAAELDDWLKTYGDPKGRLTIHRYPALNHLFLSGNGAPNPTEYGVPGSVDSKVLDDIVGFVKGVKANP